MQHAQGCDVYLGVKYELSAIIVYFMLHLLAHKLEYTYAARSPILHRRGEYLKRASHEMLLCIKLMRKVSNVWGLRLYELEFEYFCQKIDV